MKLNLRLLLQLPLLLMLYTFVKSGLVVPIFHSLDFFALLLLLLNTFFLIFLLLLYLYIEASL